MSDIAVSVRGLAKSYTIVHDQEKHSTLAETMLARLKNPLNRTKKETFWALKDVSFDIKKGEVVGIIGRNGAGKSTLLKILSRITEPTQGEIDLYGRVGSLLEVGTGFHPELTGRENIFLNGAILGMSKAEIRKQFDAIVDFAGVEQFLDTPVKRYSSGMYVRLAFAVAAHLNPKILIVDEVLAVGDAEFQKKCLGKMKDVALTGRTVLFVSHNMQAISTLTSRCILLSRGEVAVDDVSDSVIGRYHELAGPAIQSHKYTAPAANDKNYLAAASVETSESFGIHRCGQPISFRFRFVIDDPQDTLCFSFQVVDAMNRPVCHLWLFSADLPFRKRSGEFEVHFRVPRFRLYMGRYTLSTYLSDRRSNTAIETLEGICPFNISMEGQFRPEYPWQPGTCAYLEEYTVNVNEDSQQAVAV